VSELQCDLEPRAQRLTDELRHDLEGRIVQMQSNSQRLQDEIRQDLETRCAQLHGSSDSFAEELRELGQELEAQVKQTELMQQDLEAQLTHTQGLPKQVEQQIGALRQGLEERLEGRLEVRLEARMTQTHGLAQRLMNELRQDVEGQLQQSQGISQQLAQEMRQCSKDTQLLRGAFEALRDVTEDAQHNIVNLRNEMETTGGGDGGGDGVTDALEARVAQVRGAVQRLAEEVRENNDDVSTLREDMAKMIGQDFNMLKAGVGHELHGDGDSSIVEMVREVATEAVAALGSQLQQDLAAPLARCDAGATDCERIVRQLFQRSRRWKANFVALPQTYDRSWRKKAVRFLRHWPCPWVQCQ